MRVQFRIGLGLALLGLALICAVTYSTVLPGASTSMGAGRFFILGSGLIAGLLGVGLLGRRGRLEWGHLLLLAGICLYTWTLFLSTKNNSDSLVEEVILPRLYGTFLLSFGIFSIIRQRWEIFDLKFMGAVIRLLASHWGIGAIAIALVLSAFNEVIRGGVIAYAFFWLMGIGIALWLFSPKARVSTAVASAATIGFSLVAVVGSWLVAWDHPVQEWIWALTLLVLALNVGLLSFWRARHLDAWNTIDWGILVNEAGYGFAAVLAILIPVAVGGLRFSVFRGNAYDAENYFSMAAYLSRIPYSRFQDLNLLFRTNPTIFWASSFLRTRWTTSMLMAYTAQLAQVPLYRFDFAFSALPFALIFAPLFVRMRETRLGDARALLLSFGMVVGYYAQVVLDSRAVSLCTALPVLVALVLLIERIWEDKSSYSLHWPFFFGEGLVLLLLTMSLILLYVEILAIVVPGIILMGIYFVLHRELQIKKAVTVLVAGLGAVLLIYISLPLYIHFLISQVAVSQGLFVSWQNDYFQWLYSDFPAGSLGLNPYQLSPFASALLHLFAGLVLLLLASSLILLVARRKELETIFHLSSLLVIAGGLVFVYFCFRGQLWQAGKIFTYTYPFLMISLAAIPLALEGTVNLRFGQAIPRSLLLLWLVSQAGLGLYRMVVVGYGFEYPYHVQVQGTGHTTLTYRTQYAWDIQAFLNQVSAKVGPTIWVSANSVYQDMYWALAIPGDAHVEAVEPFVGGGTDTTGQTLANITRRAPDVLLISNPIWDMNPASTQIKPLVRDAEFSLVTFPQPLPSTPLIVGLRSEPFIKLGRQKTSFVLETQEWMEFLSPAECRGKVSERATLGPQDDSRIDLVVTSQPAGSVERISLGRSESVDISFPLVVGYNLISIQIPPEFQGSAFTELRMDGFSCP